MAEVTQPLNRRIFWLIAGWFSCITGHCALRIWACSGQAVVMQPSDVTGPAKEPGLTVHVNMTEVTQPPQLYGS